MQSWTESTLSLALSFDFVLARHSKISNKHYDMLERRCGTDFSHIAAYCQGTPTTTKSLPFLPSTPSSPRRSPLSKLHPPHSACARHQLQLSERRCIISPIPQSPFPLVSLTHRWHRISTSTQPLPQNIAHPRPTQFGDEAQNLFIGLDGAVKVPLEVTPTMEQSATDLVLQLVNNVSSIGLPTSTNPNSWWQCALRDNVQSATDIFHPRPMQGFWRQYHSGHARCCC